MCKKFIVIDEKKFLKPENKNSNGIYIKKTICYNNIVECYQDGNNYKIKLNYYNKLETKYISKESYNNINELMSQDILIPDNIGNRKE